VPISAFIADEEFRKAAGVTEEFSWRAIAKLLRTNNELCQRLAALLEMGEGRHEADDVAQRLLVLLAEELPRTLWRVLLPKDGEEDGALRRTIQEIAKRALAHAARVDPNLHRASWARARIDRRD
jgi:hypothetical protein